MIDITDITVRVGANVLLSQASAHISDRQKVGIVGINGCGKSTLFRVLQGEQEVEQGSVNFSSSSKIVTVEQDIKDTDLPILEFVLAQDKERVELLRQLEQASNEEIDNIHERLKAIDSSTAEARASQILKGLGFKTEEYSRKVKEYSGGWRMRLALAAALFQPSDILLLDEPTNHLDMESSIWLENHLMKYKGTLLIISHDRTILNNLCTNIIHFDNKKLILYSGNYDNFIRTRNQQKQVLERSYQKQEQKREKLQKFIDRFRYKASKAKQAQSRIKQLEKLEDVDLLKDTASLHISFPQVKELASPLINMENVSVGYGEKTILSKLNLSIERDDKIALLGKNGNGKSTFAKLLSGRLKAKDGEMRLTPKLKVGYFAQHQAEELPLDITALEYMQSLMPEQNETQIRSYLAKFGIEQEKSLRKIQVLSGGEKSRLLFAVMSLQEPELLILDEPTNHLDIESRESLIDALNEYNGAVILITHDLHLVEFVADDLWLVSRGRCQAYDGDIDDYRELILSEEKEEKSQRQKQENEKRERIKAQEAIKKQQKEQEKRLKQIEKELDNLCKKKELLENSFQENLSKETIISTQKELKELLSAIEQKEQEWLEASDKIEKN